MRNTICRHFFTYFCSKDLVWLFCGKISAKLEDTNTVNSNKPTSVFFIYFSPFIMLGYYTSILTDYKIRFSDIWSYLDCGIKGLLSH